MEFSTEIIDKTFDGIKHYNEVARQLDNLISELLNTGFTINSPEGPEATFRILSSHLKKIKGAVLKAGEAYAQEVKQYMRAFSTLNEKKDKEDIIYSTLKALYRASHDYEKDSRIQIPRSIMVSDLSEKLAEFIRDINDYQLTAIEPIFVEKFNSFLRDNFNCEFTIPKQINNNMIASCQITDLNGEVLAGGRYSQFKVDDNGDIPLE